MVALSRGCWIVSTKWLDACRRASEFVGAHEFTMNHPKTERGLAFVLKDSIAVARSGGGAGGGRLFHGWEVCVTPSVAKGSLAAVGRIVAAAGGVIRKVPPNAKLPALARGLQHRAIVADPADADVCAALRKKEPAVPIYAFDAVTVGILRQQLCFGEDFLLGNVKNFSQ